MNNVLFKRLQIAGLFIISFLGMTVSMILFFAFVDGKLFGWVENLLNALKVEGATLFSVADAAKLPDIELMSTGWLYLSILWFGLLILPAILPLLTAKREWRWVTAIEGLGITVLGAIVGIADMTMPGQVPEGLSVLVLSTIPGIIAVVLAFGWARAREVTKGPQTGSIVG